MRNLVSLLANPRKALQEFRQWRITLQVKRPLQRELSRLEDRLSVITGEITDIEGQKKRLKKRWDSLQTYKQDVTGRIRQTKETLDGIQ